MNRLAYQFKMKKGLDIREWGVIYYSGNDTGPTAPAVYLFPKRAGRLSRQD